MNQVFKVLASAAAVVIVAFAWRNVQEQGDAPEVAVVVDEAVADVREPVAPVPPSPGAPMPSQPENSPPPNVQVPEPPPGVRVCEGERTPPDGCAVWVPGGEFWRGAQSQDPAGEGFDALAGPDESPVRRVQVDGFWLARWEVIVRHYHECVMRGQCAAPNFIDPVMYNFPTDSEGVMNGVTYAEATAYCAVSGGRLPTEAEWEFAARGPAGDRFAWGNELRCANRRNLETMRVRVEDSPWEVLGDAATAETVDCAHTAPFRDFGDGNLSRYSRIWNLSGSLWEWTADYYAEDYYKDAPASNPQGPENGSRRVQRGGGWMSDVLWDFRAAGRAAIEPEMRMPDVGFRCAWSKN